MKSQRSPEKIKDHDRDLRRVRQLQQLQAEQQARLNAAELQKKKEERLEEEKKAAKKRAAELKKTQSGTTSLSMNSFSTPSYRYVNKRMEWEWSHSSRLCRCVLCVLFFCFNRTSCSNHFCSHSLRRHYLTSIFEKCTVGHNAGPFEEDENRSPDKMVAENY